MNEELKGLGALRSLSFKERNKYYANHKCERPCTDQIAEGMSRVQWLKDSYYFSLFRPKTILDCGSHDGGITRWLALNSHVERVVGIDPSRDAIAHAFKFRAQYPPEAQKKLEYYAMGFHECKLRNEFDWVVCTELIEHLEGEELTQLLHFCAGAAKPGGQLMLCTPNKYGPWGDQNPDVHHITLFTGVELVELAGAVLPKHTEFDWHQYHHKCPHLMLKATLPNGDSATGRPDVQSERGALDNHDDSTDLAGHNGDGVPREDL